MRMNAPKHTPGPWKAVEWRCHAKTTVKAGEVVVAECSGQGRYASESIADAALIAAAPDLLDALEKIATGCPPSSGEEEVIWSEVARKIAEEAIAKAKTGNTQ
jgi:hypothetical protein